MKQIALILMIMLTGCGKEQNSDSQVIAKVESSKLTQIDAEKLLLAANVPGYTLKDVVADWVNSEVLYVAANRAELDDDETLQNRVQTYRKTLLGQAFLNKALTGVVSIHNKDIKNFYDENRSSFVHRNDGAKIMHFFLRNETDANQLVDILKSSQADVDRKKLLLKYPSEIKTIEKNGLLNELQNAIFSSGKSLIGPVKTQYGYHVIDVLNRFRAGSQIDLDEAYDEIYQRLSNQQKALKSITVLDSLRNQYSIKINLERD